MMSFTHLIYIPMTGVGVNQGFRGQEWFDYRIKIFKEYTLKSLLNQSNKKFVLWLSFRKEEKQNVSVNRLAAHLYNKGIIFTMTFDGLMYWDDKFNTDFKSRWENIKRLFRHKSFNLKTFFEMLYNKNRTLEKRLGNSLYALSNNLPDSDIIYMTRLDSDDMLHKDAIAEIQLFEPLSQALTFQNGYVYNKNTDELATWDPSTNPPFLTILFNSETFFNAKKHLEYYGDFKTHEDIPRVFNSERLSNGKYCVLIHEKHISTSFNHPFRGSIVTDKLEKQTIKDSFGI